MTSAAKILASLHAAPSTRLWAMMETPASILNARDIAAVVTEGGFPIERPQVLLDRPLKTLGVHDVRIGLHAEVEPHVTINVARSADEAARQARGEQVTGKAMDEAEEEALRAKVAAEKLFEEGAGGELAEGAEESAEQEIESAD